MARITTRDFAMSRQIAAVVDIIRDLSYSTPVLGPLFADGRGLLFISPAAEIVHAVGSVGGLVNLARGPAAECGAIATRFLSPC
jgi:hypothetical protein